MWRVRDFETLSLKWDIFIKPHPSMLRNLCRRGRKRVRGDIWFKGNVSVCQTQQHRYTHELTESVTVYTRPTCTGSNETAPLAWKRGSGNKTLPLTQKLFAIVNCRTKENHFDLTEPHWTYQPHFTRGSGQYKINPRAFFSGIVSFCCVWNILF